MENGHTEHGPGSFTWEAVTEGSMDNANTDLILAAKLGKSLLEQNEELSSQYYKIVRKLETVTQENHELRRQLDTAEESNSNLLKELQLEISNLRDRLVERDKCNETETLLKEEIDRLSSELQGARERQDLMTRELSDVNEELRRERISGEDMMREVESLRREMRIVTERREDTERLVTRLQFEKERLTDSLEIAVAKVCNLEKRQADHDAIIRTNEREIDELKTSNHYLLDKLELWSMSHSSSPTMKNSLMSELELSTSDSSGDNSLLRGKPFDIIDEEDEEMEEYEMPNFDIPVIFSNDANTVEFSKINQKLRDCDNLSPVERVIDLQSKGSQTDSSSSDYQSDWHETFLSDNDLKLANLKVMELESNSKKEEIIKNGLLEKLNILEARLSKVDAENKDLLSSLTKKREKKKSDDCISPKPQSWTEEVVQLTEQNNNSHKPVSLIEHLETLETIISDILQPKDPPKKIMRIDNGYRNR